MTTPFDFVKSITQTKENIWNNEETDKGQYVPFIVNKSLSSFPDCLFFSNEMNQYPELDKDMQYLYYLNIIRQSKRFSKWLKKTDDDNLGWIREYYRCNKSRAREILKILTTEQLEEIKNKMNTGG